MAHAGLTEADLAGLRALTADMRRAIDAELMHELAKASLIPSVGPPEAV